MKLPDFEALREGSPGCPSDVTLEALHAGEPLGEDGDAVRDHTAACAACRARLDRYSLGFSAFPETDPVTLLASIRRGRPTRSPRRWPWVFVPLVALAAALFVVRSGPAPDPSEPPDPTVAPADAGADGLRPKGGVRLHVHRWTPTGSEEAASGSRFREGDRLRFIVDLPTRGHVAVLGVEPDGTLYRSWPLDRSASVPLGPATALALDGAVRLDDTVGTEVLYLVHCPASDGPALCKGRGSGPAHPPACPEVCTLSPFVLDKVP